MTMTIMIFISVGFQAKLKEQLRRIILIMVFFAQIEEATKNEKKFNRKRNVNVTKLLVTFEK